MKNITELAFKILGINKNDEVLINGVKYIFDGTFFVEYNEKGEDMGALSESEQMMMLYGDLEFEIIAKEENKIAELKKQIYYKDCEIEKLKTEYKNCSALEKQISKERQYCLDNWRCCLQESRKFQDRWNKFKIAIYDELEYFSDVVSDKEMITDVAKGKYLLLQDLYNQMQELEKEQGGQAK